MLKATIITPHNFRFVGHIMKQDMTGSTLIDGNNVLVWNDEDETVPKIYSKADFDRRFEWIDFAESEEIRERVMFTGRPREIEVAREFEFYDADHEEDPLRSYVFQSLGAASMAWGGEPTGVFNDTYAKQIGDALMAKIDELRPAQ